MIDELDNAKPRMVFGHLCDYATLGNKGKPILVGIFDIITHADLSQPIVLPASFFFTKLSSSLAAGTEHDVRIAVRHEDSKEVHRFDLGKLQFKPTGPGRPYTAQIVIAVGGMPFPELGDYTFEVIVDDELAGEVPLYIVGAPAV